MRIRKIGLPHPVVGTPLNCPLKLASPWASRGTEGVSNGVSPAVPASQTNVPVTAVIGPGVPLKVVPLITSPSTSKDVCPVDRSTRAWPLPADQGNVPAEMLPTGLSTFRAVITPTIWFQRTIPFEPANAEVSRETDNTASNTAHAFLIFFI